MDEMNSLTLKRTDGTVLGEYSSFRDKTARESTGLTDAQINSLFSMFKVCAFVKDDVSAEVDAFKTAFGVTDSGEGSGGDEEAPDAPADPDNGDVVMLRSISFDGTSYLDTGFIPENIGNKYVFGVQTVKTTDTTVQYFAGVSMRDNTSLTESSYFDYIFHTSGAANTYNEERPYARFGANIVGLDTGHLQTGADKGDGASSQPYDQPFYFAVADGEQALWLDEALTVAPTAGYFPAMTAAALFSGSASFEADKHPVMSMWLGRIRVTGVMKSQYANGGAGIKFYCFMVFDENGVMIVDMHPAKQGSTVGMWDDVRKKFYPATENGGTVSYEEVA